PRLGLLLLLRPSPLPPPLRLRSLSRPPRLLLLQRPRPAPNDAAPFFHQNPQCPTAFKINTSKSVSKQTTLTPFRMNTYEKTGGRGNFQGSPGRTSSSYWSPSSSAASAA